jgi:hypothetical integral membrane protein (TIGR02206 family)
VAEIVTTRTPRLSWAVTSRPYDLGHTGAVRVFSAPYRTTLATAIVTSAVLCIGARTRPGRWVNAANGALALLLVAVTASWVVRTSLERPWSAASSLPLPLCDVATLVAAAALWWRKPILVELTWFWGLAGTLQALLTPDLHARFPNEEFFQYVVAHVAIVAAALFLVVGQRLVPRPGAVGRALAITAVYTALVGVVDSITGGDYMYLRHPPSSWTLLRVLGPWPWYVVSAAGVAVVLLLALDAPFRAGRRPPAVR